MTVYVDSERGMFGATVQFLAAHRDREEKAASLFGIRRALTFEAGGSRNNQVEQVLVARCRQPLAGIPPRAGQ
jgi:hypothetical protein